jgi:predicted anti-sigma-YlaC factor YlaD
MEHKKIKELISSYIDGELDASQRKLVEEHLKECQECRQEFEEMEKFEEVMSRMEFKKPPKEMWQVYSDSVYNRLERKIGWILLSIGAIILLFYGGYKSIEGLIQNPEIHWILKAGILLGLAGIAVMLVSLIREQIFIYKRERYKEIEK